MGNAPNAIKSTGYSLFPLFQPVGVCQNTPLAGYSAVNAIEVTLTNVLLIGKVIDTAIQSGSTGVGSLTFSVSDPAPYRLDALKKATVAAKAKADAIAAALGMRTTAVTIVEETGSAAIRTRTPGDTAATSAPVQVGLVDVTASVALQAEIQ